MSPRDNCPDVARDRNISARLLHDACLKLGGEHRLASYLKVPVNLVDAWLTGRAEPPERVFLECLDLLNK